MLRLPLLLAALWFAPARAAEPPGLQTAAEYLTRGRATLAAPREYGDEGPAESAIEDFTKALELDPKNADAYKARAGARRYMLGDWEAYSIADLDRALALAPADSEAYRERGQWRLWSSPGDFDKVLADCGKAAALDAKDAAAYACSAEAHLFKAESASSTWRVERERAEAAFAKAAALTPRDARLRAERAHNLLQLGRLEEALGECDASLKADPGRCLLWRAEILRAMGRDEEARRDQEEGSRRALEMIRGAGTPAVRKLTEDLLPQPGPKTP